MSWIEHVEEEGKRSCASYLFFLSFFLSFFLVFFFIFFYDWRKITVQRISLQHEAAAAAVEAQQKKEWLFVSRRGKGRWTTTPLS